MSIYVLERSDGHRMPPALDDDGTSSFLAWPTLEQALQGKRFQIEMGYLEADEADDWLIRDAVSGVICEVPAPIVVVRATS